MPPHLGRGERIPKVVLYTALPAAAKVILEIDEPSKVSFAAIGGGDGVPPGMQVKYDQQVVCWVAAQHFGVAVVDDDKVTVEAGAP